MKTKVLLSLALIAIMFTCKQNKPLESPELLKQVVYDFYDGVKNKNFDKIKEVTTPDFTLYSDGKIWSYDSIVSILNSYPPYQVNYTFNNFKIDMADSLGAMQFHSHADFIFSDTLELKFDWIESATFKKLDDNWKMNFMHSTTRE